MAIPVLQCIKNRINILTLNCGIRLKSKTLVSVRFYHWLWSLTSTTVINAVLCWCDVFCAVEIRSTRHLTTLLMHQRAKYVRALRVWFGDWVEAETLRYVCGFAPAAVWYLSQWDSAFSTITLETCAVDAVIVIICLENTEMLANLTAVRKSWGHC